MLASLHHPALVLLPVVLGVGLYYLFESFTFLLSFSTFNVGSSQSGKKIECSPEEIITRLLGSEMDVTGVNSSLAIDLSSVEPPSSWLRSPISYVIFAFKREESLLQTLLSLHISLLRRQETVACYVSLHVRNYTVRDRMLEILSRVRFCDMEIMQHDIVDEASSHPEKPRESFFNEHWLWTLNEVFEVRKIVNDVIFVEDDTPLSPDHRDYAFFASRAKASPETFADQNISSRLHSLHYIAFHNFGSKISNPNDETVIIRRSFVFPTWGYMFNASFYHLLLRDRKTLLMTNYKGLPHFSAGIAKVSWLHKEFPMVQMVPTRCRSWHNGNISSIHGRGYDPTASVMHNWNLTWSSPWVESSMKPVVCNDSECNFRILKCWSGDKCVESSDEGAE